MKYRKTVRRRGKSRKNIAQRKKRSRKQKKRTTMKGGREKNIAERVEKNIAERVINIIDRVIEALDQVQKREAELKDAELKAKATSGIALKDDPKYKRYAKYFTMLKAGLPRHIVKTKMEAGLDNAILDLDPNQPAPNSMKVSGEPVAKPPPHLAPMSGVFGELLNKKGEGMLRPVNEKERPKIQQSKELSPEGQLVTELKKFKFKKKKKKKNISKKNKNNLPENNQNNGPAAFNVNKFERNIEEQKLEKIERLVGQTPFGQFKKEMKAKQLQKKREASKDNNV